MNPSYIAPRQDLLALIPGEPQRVLDVGCATGATAMALKVRYPNVRLTGIEIDADMADAASTVMSEVIVGDALTALNQLVDRNESFDLVLCGDVLEHLEDPWTTLKLIRRLCQRGHVITSLPNIAHLSTLYTLAVNQYWPYRSRGIHDRTHLRFFASNNLPEVFQSAGFEEVDRRVHHRVIEKPHRINTYLHPLLMRLPVARRLTAYQFVSLLR